MRWTFLSPHYDDVALSCGGLIWELSQAGQVVEICTVCSGEPPEGPLSAFAVSLHARWETGGEAVAARKSEDQASCAVLGACWRYMEIPDCIYRPGGSTGHFCYATEESLFGELAPEEASLVDNVAAKIQDALSAEDLVVGPLTLGGHVDHRLTRRAVEQMGRPALFYADYPYRLEAESELAALSASGWQPVFFPVSLQGLSAWQDAVAAHVSQISTFWASLDAMRTAIQSLWKADGCGTVLWKPPTDVGNKA